MDLLRFKIIKKCYQDASEHNDDVVDFYLEESDWNDYGYLTSYCLHASKKITNSTNKYLGYIRIMKKGQSESDMYLLRSLYKDSDLVFSELPEDFISLTFSIEIYEELNRLLDYDQKMNFINAMRLILGDSSKFYDNSLKDDNCFNDSLLRDSSSLDDYYLNRGRQLLEGVEKYYDLREQNLNVRFLHIKESVSFDFSCIDDLSSDLLPNGVSVFIGKNGSGKSTAIYSLAKLLYSNPTERFRIKDTVGELEPNNIGVNKLFLITYSPFDNFVMPGIINSDYKLMFSKENIGEQRFIFCGVRDLEEEYKQKCNQQAEEQEDCVWQNRQKYTYLKSIDKISNEFIKALEVIFKGTREGMWDLLCENSKKHQPMLYNDIIKFPNEWGWDNADYPEKFNNLSTGHKFILHSIAHLIAYIENDSLVLFDEPENHLHPPLLSFLMTQMRIILSKYKSVMLIATHSPVVLQEVFAKNVYIVRRDEDGTIIKKPRIETYGENISTITSEVFDLTSDITNFYEAFDYLYKKWEMQNEPDVEAMLRGFKEKIGHQLSNQMVSYIINLYGKNRKNVEIS